MDEGEGRSMSRKIRTQSTSERPQVRIHVLRCSSLVLYSTTKYGE